MSGPSCRTGQSTAAQTASRAREDKVERTSACLHGGDKLGVASTAATEHKAALPKLTPTTSAPGVTDCGRPDGPSSALSGRRVCDRPDCVRCRDSVRSRHDIFEHEIATRRLHPQEDGRTRSTTTLYHRLVHIALRDAGRLTTHGGCNQCTRATKHERARAHRSGACARAFWYRWLCEPGLALSVCARTLVPAR